MTVWENGNIKVEIKKGEWYIYYKRVNIQYSKETLKQILKDVQFEIRVSEFGDSWGQTR